MPQSRPSVDGTLMVVHQGRSVSNQTRDAVQQLRLVNATFWGYTAPAQQRDSRYSTTIQRTPTAAVASLVRPEAASSAGGEGASSLPAANNSGLYEDHGI